MADARARNTKLWDRDPHEWYVEPARVTRQLMEVESFPGKVWDPCCGRGNIVEAFNAVEPGKAYGTDLVDRFPEGRPRWFGCPHDFLKDTGPYGLADCIVMNPPFGGAKLAEAFIRQALISASFKLAVFVDVRFLTGGKRAVGLWKDRCPNRVWHVTPRPSCPPGTYLMAGGKAANGTSDYAWLVYDLTTPAPAAYQGGWLTPASTIGNRFEQAELLEDA